uniref:Uncharacterized protein n=1 Tax=Anguilla anguilla TaxID=7936 RepID=A0A0E9V6F9_ANGAN
MPGQKLWGIPQHVPKKCITERGQCALIISEHPSVFYQKRHSKDRMDF